MGQFIPPNPTARIPEYWMWIALTLFVLFPVDLLTTLVAVGQFGLAAEANPFMRWLIAQGFLTLTVVHLLLVVVATVCCHGILEAIRTATDRSQRSLAVSFEITLGVLLSVGLLVISNNLSVIVLQQNLLVL
jgi:hypothetical protein